MTHLPNAVRWLATSLAVLVCLALPRPRAAGVPVAPVGDAPGAVRAQDPRVWAGVSASVAGATTNAMFSVGEVNRLVIGVALVNDGDAPIPFDRAATRLVINGQPVKLFDGTGPVWTEVKPGRPFGASTGGVAGHFSKPGLYKIQWAGDGFSSSVQEVRVTRD